MARYWQNQTTNITGHTDIVPEWVVFNSWIAAVGTWGGATLHLEVNLYGIGFVRLDDMDFSFTEDSISTLSLPANAQFRFVLSGATAMTSISVSIEFHRELSQ